MNPLLIRNSSFSRDRFPFLAFLQKDLLKQIEENMNRVRQTHSVFTHALSLVYDSGVVNIQKNIIIALEMWKFFHDETKTATEGLMFQWDSHFNSIMISENYLEDALELVPSEFYLGKYSFPAVMLLLEDAVAAMYTELQFGFDKMLMNPDPALFVGIRQSARRLDQALIWYSRLGGVLNEYRQSIK